MATGLTLAGLEAAVATAAIEEAVARLAKLQVYRAMGPLYEDFTERHPIAEG